MNKHAQRKCHICLGLLILCGTLWGQNSSALKYFNEGETLRKTYRFTLAQEAYTRALSASEDSLLSAQASQRIILCENGLSLLNYVADPIVKGKWSVPKKDFQLYFSQCPSGQWITPPKDLLLAVNDNEPTTYPVFYRQDTPLMVFAAKDSLRKEGWDIYTVRRKEGDGNHWEAPVRLGTQINSPGNELYPTLSRDASVLFFCSDQQYGLGGYNLYMSEWDADAQDWGPAQNLGIPYSSPYDDYLYMVSDDLAYACFVSDREELKDSLTMYCVEYEVAPLKIAPSSVEEIQRIAQLDIINPGFKDSPVIAPSDSTLQNDEELATTRQAMDHYIQLVGAVREAMDKVKTEEQKLQQLRETYQSLSRDEDKVAMARTIEEEEFVLMDLQGDLRQAQEAAQSVEDRFLATGVLPPLVSPSDNEEQTTAPGQSFTFTPLKQTQGILANQVFERPVPEIPPIDLTFRIEEESELVDWNEYEPEGLYYRIQLFTVGSKAALRQLKGLCPAFEVKAGSRYVYYAGQFSTYNEAAKALTTAKRRGFNSAILVAYYQKKNLTVQAARQREASRQTAPEGDAISRIFLDNKDLSAEFIKEVSALSSKDIYKEVTDTETRYYIGPFTDSQQAEEIAEALRQKGFSQTNVEPVN